LAPDLVQQPAGAPEPGGASAHRRGGHLPQPRRDHPARGRRARRTARRVAGRSPLHGRGGASEGADEDRSRRAREGRRGGDGGAGGGRLIVQAERWSGGLIHHVDGRGPAGTPEGGLRGRRGGRARVGPPVPAAVANSRLVDRRAGSGSRRGCGRRRDGVGPGRRSRARPSPRPRGRPPAAGRDACGPRVRAGGRGRWRDDHDLAGQVSLPGGRRVQPRGRVRRAPRPDEGRAVGVGIGAEGRASRSVRRARSLPSGPVGGHRALTGAHPPFAFARRTAVALSAIAGLAALWGALARLGWAADAWSAREALWHGALAVLGFLGTMIAAERATALGRPWAFGAPIATGLGAIALLASPSPRSAQLLFLSGALVLVAIFAVVYRLQPALHNAVLGIGSLLWVVSIALWFGGFPLYRVAPWWAGMLVATIVGERLELSRLVGLSPRARGSFVAGIAVHVGGLVLSVAWFGWGVRVAGLGLVALAAWLVRHDAARRTIHGPPLPRFMAACLLSGYLWLAAGGAAWAWFGGVIAGPGHDAMLHAVFVGFVMSM